MTDYPQWPSYALPAPPLNDSYKISLPNNGIRTDMEQGPAFQRGAFRSGMTAYNITWPMTPLQFQIYLGVSKHLLSDAQGWFRLPVFDGADYTERVVRFVSQPVEPTRDGGEFMTSAIIETMDDIVMSSDDTQAALLSYGSDLDVFGVADLLRYALREAYPESLS